MAEDLVDKVINFFSGDGTDKMSDKEVVLKQRYKELGENRYAKFYKMKTDEADPSLAQFFLSLYKMILPIRNFMKDTTKSIRIRQIVLEAFLDPTIVEIVKRMHPAAIEQRFKKTLPAELAEQIHSDIDALRTEFDSDRISGVNRCYNLVMAIYQLVAFDYPSLLKRFDNNFSELAVVNAKFSAVKGSAIAKGIGDFLAVAKGINPDSDWKTLLRLLRLCAGEELIPDSQFAQILLGLRDVVNSNILELIVQCGSRNPIWACKPRFPDEHIAEAWLDFKIGKAQECVDKINKGEKNKQISALLKEIFYGGDLIRLDFYTPARGEVYQKKELTGFTYAEGINYLAVFIAEYLEKDINDLFDLLLVRGQWTNNSSSKEVSEAFHQLMELPMSVSSLDESLSDDGVDGSRIKAAFVRVDRDPSQGRYINSIIDGVNETAQEILETAGNHFAILEKHLKNLVDDVQKKHPELLVNWKELNSVSKDPMLQQMAEDHRRINCFVQLMRLCAE
jgi:hypothetical protein